VTLWPGAQLVSLVLGAALCAAACQRAKPHDAPAPKACRSNQDCDDGWACLAQRCYDTRKSAAFTHPEQQVTPDRVRQEVEHQQDEHLRRIEKDLEGEGAPANR
jgi:hypothetical protein